MLKPRVGMDSTATLGVGCLNGKLTHIDTTETIYPRFEGFGKLR